jgi:steroid delta-isomerase-like uncharacterized protein
MKNLIFLLFILGMFAACDNAGHAHMTVNDHRADHKARVQQFYDQVINAHNVAMIDSFCHDNFVDHNPDMGHSGQGVADLKAQFTEFFAAFPDIHASVNFMVAEGDTVVSHLTMTGTNTGPMAGMPATNKKISISGVDIVSIKDNKATERWGFFDTQKMMADMGMGMGAPPPAPADTTKTMEMKK